MKKCLCALVVFLEPCFHAVGIHTGLESIAPLAMNYLVTLED